MASATPEVFQAFTRFGLGARPDDPQPTDARAWLLGQLSGPDPMPTQGLPSLVDCLTLLAYADGTVKGSPARVAAGVALDEFFAAEVQAFLTNAVITQVPFRERLVWFWANHLAVQAIQRPAQVTAGVYAREAIRPYVLGSFADMLVAAIQHPSMLFSLNNNVSVGPDSPAAVERRGLNGANALRVNINENLGRELLELHTVGVAAGYTQADVDAMAYLLTGFTVNVKSQPQGFTYRARVAQPGYQTLLGQTYPNTQEGCIAALRWLATQPATYWHLATKLATHFTTDAPAEGEVRAIYTALAGSGGNLAAAAAAVVDLPGAWRRFTKLRTPQELVVAALRALGTSADAVPKLLRWVTALGQETFRPPFPNGWSDIAADWAGPEALLARMDWACRFAASVPAADPAAVADCALGPRLSAGSAAIIGAATSSADQLTLLFCSPEFQRR